MTAVIHLAPAPADAPARLPTHKDLPETDGTHTPTFHEKPQTHHFNRCIYPHLADLFPDGQFLVGSDNGIYWLITDPPLRGCKSPDWFLVVGVPPMLDGEVRRSYVLWQERVAPLLVVEYVSGDGAEERDRTPETGKFWVYERGIKAGYYAILDGFRGTLELYRRAGEVFVAVPANAAGRLPIPELGIELGLWRGTLMGTTAWYARPWRTSTGEMLPSPEESARQQRRLADEQRRVAEEQRRLAEEHRLRAEEQRRLADEQSRRAEEQSQRADEEQSRRADEQRQRADEAERRNERLAARLRELGVDPE